MLIKTLVDLPSVGQNLIDQPFVANTWLVNSTDTFETALRNETLMEEQIRELAGWLRVPDNASIFQQFPDPSAGPNSGHFESIMAVRSISNRMVELYLFYSLSI